MLPEEVLDLLGQRVEVGDRIAAAFRCGDAPELRVGTVVGYGYKRGYGYVLLEIKWDHTSVFVPEKSKIETHHKRFVRMDNDERKQQCSDF